MDSSARERVKLAQDAAEPAPTLTPAPAATPRASRNGDRSVHTGDMRSRRRSLLAALWPAPLALLIGCVAAAVLLATSLQTEFPLYSEASAERGRDCTAIRSARHALEETLQARLPMRAPDAEAARAIRSAVAAFDARTQDIATPAVEAALGPVRGNLDDLSDSVQLYAASPAGSPASQAVDDAMTRVDESWRGAIARVCT